MLLPMLLKWIRNLHKARIILRIWLKSIYQITVNYLTTGESVPRVPHIRRVKGARSGCDQVVQVFLLWALHRWDKNPGGEVSLY
jgi:hypothetical protein